MEQFWIVFQHRVRHPQPERLVVLFNTFISKQNINRLLLDVLSELFSIDLRHQMVLNVFHQLESELVEAVRYLDCAEQPALDRHRELVVLLQNHRKLRLAKR